MADAPATSLYADATAMGPVHDMAPTDLLGASSAPDDVRYQQAPAERDLWQFGVDQAGQVIGGCHAGTDAGTADMGSLDGPYDCGTTQPGVPQYGMAGH